MPWSDYPKDVRQFSSIVRAAAEERFGAAATVDIVNQAAKAAGIGLSFQSFSSIAKLYGEFTAMRNVRETIADTAQTVQRTGIDQGITASMIGRAPWSPTDVQLSRSPFVLVLGRYTQDTPEGPKTGYFPHRYHISQVNSYQGLVNDLQLQMEQNAGGTDLAGAQLQDIVSIEWSTA